jgi:3-oxoacyl-[acyl-carrier-protein] synthase III
MPTERREGIRFMDGSTIVGLGCYLPERVVTSDEVAETLGLPTEWIHTRTGIRTRHLAADNETTVDLAVAAARDALATSGTAVASIDAVIVATCTGERMPNTASQVAGALGLTGAAFDINAACAGFCHALAVADGLIRTGATETVLVIGADKSSSSIDWHDRNTAPLFGDGAGAAIVRRSADPGIGPTAWGSYGDRGSLVRLGEDMISQDGPVVFRWAIGLGEKVRDVCRIGGVKPQDVAAFVPHQANLRIIDALAADLNAPDAVIAREVVTVGNTMAASVPIALARLAQRGELPIGGPIVLFGFGSGLTYAGQTVELSHDLNASVG